MEKHENVDKIDIIPLLKSAWKEFKRSWKICAILVVITGVLGVLNSARSYTPVYKVTAAFVVNAGSNDNVMADYYDKITTDQLNQTFPYILNSGALAQVVANDLGYESVPATISTEAVGETNLFKIVVTGSDPRVVSDVLESVIKNYPEVAKYVLGSTELTLLKKSDVPTKPINQRNVTHQTGKYMIFGFGLYLLFLWFQIVTNRTVQNKAMLSRYISIPNMGSIPKVRMAKRTRKKAIRITDKGVTHHYSESMEAIQSRITKKMKNEGWKALYITSSLAGEGKTTMACNLAILMARRGARVLLIDGDLRNPSVAQGLGYKIDKKNPKPGLSDILMGKAKVSEVLMKSDIPNLYVIPGGAPIGKVSNLFLNGKYKNLIATSRKQMDYIIVDTPPCSFIHDTALIADELDGGFLVVRQDYAPIERVVSGTELLAKTHAPLFGCGLNCADRHVAGYGYGYGRYGYGRYGYGYGKKYGYGYGYGEKKK